jgi:drug/metabolite transporter (DMT)-like permease
MKIYVKLVLVALFWGGTFIATRTASVVFEPFTGAAIRYIIATMVLLPLALRSDAHFWRRGFKQIFPLALLGLSGVFAYNYFFFKGLRMVETSHAALIVALNPIMVMLFSAWRYGEKIRGFRLAGMLLALTGVLFVISRGRPAAILTAFEWGDFFMLGCPITWAAYTIAGRNVLKSITPLQATAWASLLGGTMLSVAALFEPHPNVVPLNVWISLAYLGLVGTVLAFIWYYQGVLALGVTRTAIFNNLVPVFALLLSVTVLQESVPVYTWIGATLVVAGVVLTNIRSV